MLHAVEAGFITRGMISSAPRTGKTKLVTQSFIPWYLGRNPDAQVILVCYGGGLATWFGRSIRNVMQGIHHTTVFPGARLAIDSKAANLFAVRNKQGVFSAASPSGRITGMGANLIVIDDILKGREAADSDHMKQKIWEWYTDDLYTRLNYPELAGATKEPAILCIGTRWALDDPMSKMLKNEKWEHLHLKAWDEENKKALWPYTPRIIDRLRHTLPETTFSALYQGEPTLAEGNMFKHTSFVTYKPAWMKEQMRTNIEGFIFYLSSDYAFTERDGDYTVFILWAIDHRGNIFLVSIWRERATPKQWFSALIGIARQFPIAVYLEESNNAKQISEFLSDALKDAGVRLKRKAYHSSQNKVLRARTAEARFSFKPLLIPNPDLLNDPEQEGYDPEQAELINEYVKEMKQFPNGEHDDMVDATSLFTRHLQNLRRGESPVAYIPEVEDILDAPSAILTADLLKELG